MEIRPSCRPPKRLCAGDFSKCPKGSGKTICVCKCPCGKGKYRQPPRPRSFAPCVTYNRPACPLECNTVYRKSYLPTCTERAAPCVPSCTLGVPQARFAQDTVNRMSYPGWCNIKPPSPFAPCHHLSAGDGPIAEITTTRHDYVPKPFTKAAPLVPCHNIFTTNQPISDQTINRLSYQPVCTERPIPIIPQNSLGRPDGEISNITVHKISYQPVPLPCKGDLPWAAKKCYEPPCQPFAKDTIYKKSYQECNVPRTQPIVPACQGNPLTSGTCFDSCTVYRGSYLPNNCVQIPAPCKPNNNIEICKEKISCDTINKMSYRPNCGFKPPAPMMPCSHQLLGLGPMAEITTTRHDYVPKPIVLVSPCVPGPTICSSNEPLSNATINRLSYLPNCNYATAKPIIPANTLDKATGMIESCTIQKLSYQPIGPIPKCDVPWAMKKCYEPPTSRMVCDTIYNLSYDCPGEYTGDDCSCRCAYEEPPCIPQNCLNPILV